MCLCIPVYPCPTWLYPYSTNGQNCSSRFRRRAHQQKQTRLYYLFELLCQVNWNPGKRLKFIQTNSCKSISSIYPAVFHHVCLPKISIAWFQGVTPPQMGLGQPALIKSAVPFTARAVIPSGARSMVLTGCLSECPRFLLNEKDPEIEVAVASANSPRTLIAPIWQY